jgi:hypothetical protein
MGPPSRARHRWSVVTGFGDGYDRLVTACHRGFVERPVRAGGALASTNEYARAWAGRVSWNQSWKLVSWVQGSRLGPQVCRKEVAETRWEP